MPPRPLPRTQELRLLRESSGIKILKKSQERVNAFLAFTFCRDSGIYFFWLSAFRSSDAEFMQ